jgi:hypothetical protein
MQRSQEGVEHLEDEGQLTMILILILTMFLAKISCNLTHVQLFRIFHIEPCLFNLYEPVFVLNLYLEVLKIW